ncbi:MAG: deoxyuridine 5'-triphosphate nucleotidohydrolase [Candidatus Omnitrophica bacterium]|nr:deoxyuridine 5'-triphosphate nucleotidohydrolase [Candidatus Omnitrophota bacterium]
MLNREEIEKLIKEKDLITDYIDVSVQLTPNGFDLTAAQIFAFDGVGAVDFSNKERVIPEGKELCPLKEKDGDRYGWWHLQKGAYKIKTNETVSLPKDLLAIAFTRSSLLRIGAFTQNGVWDAGFKGKSEFILIVENPAGIKVKQNARILQLIFTRINETLNGYDGVYQNKK